MTDETPGLPSTADLDTVASEQPTAKDTHDKLIADLTKQVPPPTTAPPEPPVEAPVAVTPSVPDGTVPPERIATVNGHGQIWDSTVFASYGDGSPKTDSTGRYIMKEHDYNPRTPNIAGGK